ncbi:hypothetical protein [Streptomyces sp. NPDC088557]|uniref:hypothetical protein n=1 Tax=Streptomyces sp. NPDC088557 TaxID=3365867 RepID=UPI0037FDA93F
MPEITRTGEMGDAFVVLSVRLTGFDADELAATGMTDAYRDVVQAHTKPDHYARLVTAADEAPPTATGFEAPEDVAGLAEAVTRLWYTGVWPGLDGTGPFLVSARAYAEGLVWRTFGGRAPGTSPQGFGSWAARPAAQAGPAGPGTPR